MDAVALRPMLVQIGTQKLLTHDCDELHGEVHPPQCCGSDVKSTHFDPHWVVPGKHGSWQPDGVHTVPPVQTVPQAPQLLGSLVVSVQNIPRSLAQVVRLGPQSATQVPLAQTKPAPQMALQLPQLKRSVWVLAQLEVCPLEHSISDGGQVSVHLPARHACAAEQVFPQSPQFPGSTLVSTQTSPHLVVPPLQ
jgi:hypothetical protein